jgi:hypothetical protein
MQGISKFIIALSLFALSTKMCAQTVVANAIGCNGTLYTIYSDGTWKAASTINTTTTTTPINENDRYYSGSASVSVEDKDGRKRIITVLCPCYYAKGKSKARAKLLDDIKRELKSDENMTSTIAYDLEICS